MCPCNVQSAMSTERQRLYVELLRISSRLLLTAMRLLWSLSAEVSFARDDDIAIVRFERCQCSNGRHTMRTLSRSLHPHTSVFFTFRLQWVARTCRPLTLCRKLHRQQYESRQGILRDRRRFQQEVRAAVVQQLRGGDEIGREREHDRDRERETKRERER